MSDDLLIDPPKPVTRRRALTVVKQPEPDVLGIPDAILTADARFERLLGLSLDAALAIMELPLDPKNPHFAKILSTQQSIMSSVFSTTARTNDSLLRKRQTDRLDEILKLIKDQEEI